MEEDFPMTSSKPYILRGLFQWIVDNGATPYLLVDAGYEGVMVPTQHVDDNNQIILNISPTACHGMTLGDTDIMFNARFSGQPMEVIVPLGAALAMYARENGQGMVFGAEPGGDLPPEPPAPEPAPEKSKRSHLSVVK